MTDTPNLPRFHDATAMFADENDSYDFKAKGQVRRAQVYDRRGRLLGDVWTDDRQAAGFSIIDDPEPDMGYAESRMDRILTEAYKAGTPASQLLDPALYAPDFELRLTP
ncbi:hypothetical protein MTP10_13685 [Nonomuraea sp. 3-1Str]|uniref:hypothetical protein n=1 Tax=Nonomuraea sp. 3-1Str TaxID=2929801 RepID=UPI002856CED2|nr:hypothetical protein [Nonomuraea sp. 3-1Str]MDR8409787.1 hypothetical protein [Nonomuraea sp. 3-1Str]